jgi:hypothetical protein
MTTRASVGSRESLGDVRPPASVRPSFTASDGRQVWELEPDLFLVQRNAGPDADDICVPIVFDVDGIAPRRWAPSANGRRRERAHAAAASDAMMPTKGLALGLAMSLPIWAITLWAVRRVLGEG